MKTWTNTDREPSHDRSGGCSFIPASAVILGGGQGKRMGDNKLFLKVEDTLLIQLIIWKLSSWFKKIIITVGPEDRTPLEKLLGEMIDQLDLRIITDSEPGRGPLEGLATSLEHLDTDWAFVVGCDMPFIKEAVIRSMWKKGKEESSVICACLDGFIEPLHAFYRTLCLPAIRGKLASGRRKLTSFYEDVDVTMVSEETLKVLPGYRRSFRSINTPGELRKFIDPGIP